MAAIHPSRHAGWCPVARVIDAKDPDDCACGVHDEPEQTEEDSDD